MCQRFVRTPVREFYESLAKRGCLELKESGVRRVVVREGGRAQMGQSHFGLVLRVVLALLARSLHERTPMKGRVRIEDYWPVTSNIK